MHEAIYNAQGRFHISENKTDTRDLFRFLYNLLQNCRKRIGILSHASASRTVELASSVYTICIFNVIYNFFVSFHPPNYFH